MTDARAREMFEELGCAAIETYHVLYPEDVYVTADTIIGWAHDALVNAAVDDYVRLHGPLTDDQAYEILAAGVQMPDLHGAMEILSDIGSHTFARLDVQHRMVAHMSDVPGLRALARRCFPKEQHTTRGKAEAQMRSLLKRDLHKNERLHVYECPHCGAWHVGHGDGRPS
jgi:hypothetical protein